MSRLLTRIADNAWQYAFYYAGGKEPGGYAGGGEAQPVQVVPNGNCSDAPFTRRDVKKIVYIEDGENDEEAWIGVFLLKDGRYAYLEAGCDYTGWD